MSKVIIPQRVNYCVQDNCPKATQCARHILYQNNTQDKPSIMVLNPLLTPFNTDGCAHFREYKTVRYARGFRNIYNAIPVRLAKKFWTTLPSITSESMYYRMKRGERLLSPSLQQEILDAARRLGVPPSVGFDAYCDVLEV